MKYPGECCRCCDSMWFLGFSSEHAVTVHHTPLSTRAQSAEDSFISCPCLCQMRKSSNGWTIFLDVDRVRGCPIFPLDLLAPNCLCMPCTGPSLYRPTAPNIPRSRFVHFMTSPSESPFSLLPKVFKTGVSEVLEFRHCSDCMIPIHHASWPFRHSDP